MLNWLQNAKISTRLMACIVVPTLALMLVFGIVMASQFQAELKLIGVRDTVKLAPPMSDLIHEMQRERGQSAGFISSNGQAFSDTLPSVRKQVDARLAAMKASIVGFDFASHDPASREFDQIGNYETGWN